MATCAVILLHQSNTLNSIINTATGCRFGNSLIGDSCCCYVHQVFDQIQKLLPILQLISQTFRHRRLSVYFHVFDVLTHYCYQTLPAGSIPQDIMGGSLVNDSSFHKPTVDIENTDRSKSLLDHFGWIQDRFNKVLIRNICSRLR